VKHVGSELRFPDEWTDDQILKFYSEADGSDKLHGECHFKSFEPSDSDKAVVQGILKSQGGAQYDVNKFGFYMIYGSDTLVDLMDEKCTKALLQELAKQYVSTDGRPGKSALINHGIDNFAGASFGASVDPKEGAAGHHVLWVKTYVPDMLNFNGNKVIDLINTGVISKASIRFRPGKVSYEDLGDKFVGVLDVSAERKSVALEISWCYHGAVEGTYTKSYGTEKPVILNRSSNMSFITKTLEFGQGDTRKRFDLKIGTGDNPTVEGLGDIESYVKSLLSENSTLKAAELESKKPMVEGIISLQKKLQQPTDTDSYLYSLKYADLDARMKYLQKIDVAANPKGQATNPDARPELASVVKSIPAPSGSFFDSWDDDKEE
jgi:hypothetical protein